MTLQYVIGDATASQGAGLRVVIALRAASPVRKQDQRTGRHTFGVVQVILTSAERHTRGIKLRLTDGQIGRVQEIEPAEGPGAPATYGEGEHNAAS